MKTKRFYVVAYDIAHTKRRNKVVKTLQKFGTRVNLSVFECMLTEIQLAELTEKIKEIIVENEDQVIIYYLCKDCFAKIRYIPDYNRKTLDKIVVV